MKRFVAFLLIAAFLATSPTAYAGGGSLGTSFGTPVGTIWASPYDGNETPTPTPIDETKLSEAVKLAADGPFVFHNGCKFGDTYETVNSKDHLGYISENKLYNISAGVKDRKYSYGEPGMLAGIEKGQVAYYFIDNILCEVQYKFGGFRDFSLFVRSYGEYYDFLRNALTEKYGKPLGNRNNSYYPITGEELTVCRAKAYDFVLDPLRYDEWVVDCGNYFVKIDLCGMRYDENDDECYITLGYLPFTQSDLDNLLAAEETARAQAAHEEEAHRQELMKSLNDDI